MTQGILRISHATAITRFVHKHNMEQMNPSVVPCTVDLQKQIKNFEYANTPGEAEETEAIISPYRMYLGAMGHWAQTTMPQMKSTVRMASKYMSRPTKIYAHEADNHGDQVLYEYSTRGHTVWIRWGTRSDVFHRLRPRRQCRRQLRTSGMMAFVSGNYFHGYSSGQKCLTLNTAESEYIAMVKCLRFAIWTMLLLSGR
jgi:hypothetical protein